MPNPTLTDVFDEVVYDNNAQEVFKKLNDLDNKRDVLVSRWVWELIQNARGTAGSQNALQIEVVLDRDQFGFRQDPSYFGLDDVIVCPVNAALNVTQITALPDGGIQITVTGLPGTVFRVLGSTNLMTWQTVATLTNATGAVEFIDPGVTGSNCRFYRLVMP